MHPNRSTLSTYNQVKTLKILQDYGILSSHVISAELKITVQQAGQLIDFLFIQGFLTQKESIKTEERSLKHSCLQGCEGCPFNSIAQCHEKTPETNHYFLTQNAIVFLKTNYNS
ncbi:MAG: hypothetical protein ACTSVZ_13960 [Promethearchaeota archaeon]